MIRLDVSLQISSKLPNEYNGKGQICLPCHKIRSPCWFQKFFSGEVIEGSEFIEEIERAYTSNAVTRNITDASTCNANPIWLNALASHIFQSLNKSRILSFLTTELKEEKTATLFSVHLMNTFQRWTSRWLRLLTNGKSSLTSSATF